jgi:hypothetical protein
VTTIQTEPASANLPGDPGDLAEGGGPYEACDHCSAPVDVNQRYCVVCGTRRKHVYDPAARYLSGATSLARAQRSPARASSARRGRSFGLGPAAALVLIPLAVAVGVLVGRAGSSNDGKLLAALKAQKPTVVSVGGGSGTAASGGSAASTVAASSSTLTSTFSLTKGFTVELQAIAHPTQSSVNAAEQTARTKGASAVGLITPSGFKLTPAPPSGEAVIYSGQFSTRAAANSALAKLKRTFPSAKVVAVASNGSAGGGKVLAKTSFGSANQVTGFKPTASQLAAGRQVAAKTAKQLNGNYVKSQQGLPSQVSVP